MAHPRVFVSSTYYDLKHLRSSLENFIESLGYEPLLSEKGDIAYAPDRPLDESCYREVRNADMFVLIIGGRYGSEKSDGNTDIPKKFFDRYDSITKLEYKSAVAQDIPIFILIEKTVYSDFETYLKNKDNKSIVYAHADSVNIFHLIEDILSQPRNNPFQQFDRYSDIEAWLREQWAGLFRELISRLSSQKQIASLASQVGELAEINKTLKTYLEEVVSKVAPDESTTLINSESKRLHEAQQIARIKTNELVSWLDAGCELSPRVTYKVIVESSSYEDFVRRVLDKLHKKEDKEHANFIFNTPPTDYVLDDLNQARATLKLNPLSSENENPSTGQTKPTLSSKHRRSQGIVKTTKKAGS